MGFHGYWVPGRARDDALKVARDDALKVVRYPTVMPDLIRYPLRHAGLDPVSMRRQILVVFWVPGRARDDALKVAWDDALKVAREDAG